MIHVHSGDHSAETARRRGLEGSHIAWREAIATGPAPADASMEQWVDLRAHHLAAISSTPVEETRRTILDLFDELRLAAGSEVTALWFGPDLFCTANLLFVLQFLQNAGTEASSLLVLPGDDPSAASLDGAHRLTHQELTAAASAWHAFGSPEPFAITDWLAVMSRSAPTPFLERIAASLRVHLERFPSVHNGLGLEDQTILELLSDGEHDVATLETRFIDARASLGWGDLQVRDRATRLAEGSTPLVRQRDDDDGTVIELTEDGWSVMMGESDAVELRGIDEWIGGTHLTDALLFRWNGEALVAEEG